MYQWVMRRVVAVLLVSVVGAVGLAGCSMLPFTDNRDDGSLSNSLMIEVRVASDTDTAKGLEVKVDARNNPHRFSERDVPLEYVDKFEVPLDIPIPLSGVTVEETSAEDASWISCTITLDGDVVAEQRVSGAGKTAVCEKKLRISPQ